MASITDAQIDAAIESGTHEQESELRAVTARYDRQLDRLIVDLTNGCTFVFPPHMAQGLEQAAPATREGRGAGPGLRSVLRGDKRGPVDPHSDAGIFGTKTYMARRAGQAISPATATAARANGARGGRPRKVVHT